MNRKGVSPLIASVLLLAVSISVVGIFSGWAPELAQTVTDETTNSTLETLECEDASIQIQSAFHDDGADELNVTLLNDGDTDLPSITLATFDENDQLGEQTTTSVDAGNIDDDTISDVTDTPSYVQAISETCSNARSTLDDINT